MGIRLKDFPRIRLPAALHVVAGDGAAGDISRKKGDNKFGARRTTCPHGHQHDSGAEAQRCAALHLLQRSGLIRALEQQPVYFLHNRDGSQVRFENGRAARFKPDFRYEEQGPDGIWRTVVEDVKSPVTMTEAFQLRAAVWRGEHPGIELRITS